MREARWSFITTTTDMEIEDNELQAIDTILFILTGLTGAQKERVLGYVLDRSRDEHCTVTLAGPSNTSSTGYKGE